MAFSLLLTAARVFGAVAKSGLNLSGGKGKANNSITKLTTTAQDTYLLPENREEMLKMKIQMATEVVYHAKKYLNDEDINYTMNLSDSIYIYTVGDTVYVRVDSPHAAVVEYGLAPGTVVNVDALKDWVEGKLGIKDPKERDEVAFKIFNKIKREGIRPTKFFTKAILALKKSQPKTTKTKKGKSGLEKAVKTVKKISRITRKYIKYTGIK